ncbi:MAG: hypothetical protein IJ553_06085 [Alloprevotella sp.]|nr:hypothetical protein [Alloprevotella sp.]
MKKTVLFACLTGLMLFVSCGEKKQSLTGNEKVDEIVDEAIKDFASMTGVEKFQTVLKDYKLSLSDIAPDFAYAEETAEGKSNFYGVKDQVSLAASAMFMKKEGGDVTQAEYEAFVRKAYEATKKVSQDGKNIVGFMEASNLEDATKELPLDKLLGKSFMGQPWNLITWYFRQGDVFYSCTTDLKDANKVRPASISFVVDKSIQKSLDDTMKDAEKALDDPRVQEILKDLSKNN